MLFQKFLQLLVQPLTQGLCLCCKIQIIRTFHTKHTGQPPLKSCIIIFQCQIQHCPFPYRIIPQRNPHCYMIGKLRHKERFSHLWRTYKEIYAAIEKAVYNRYSRHKNSIIQFRHGHGMQSAIPGFLWVFGGLLIDLFLRICYNFIVIFFIRLHPICANR